MAADGDDTPTRDALLDGRVTLLQPRRGHRAGHDAVLLAAFAPASARSLVDFGAGTGAAGLCALRRLPAARGTLVEIDPALAALAAENVALNDMTGRCAVVSADVTHLARPGGPSAPAAGEADLVIANPPFNARAAHQASPEAGRALAHMADGDWLAAWTRAAYRCLGPSGVVCLILRPQDLAGLLAALEGRFGALELLPVHPAPSAPAVRLLARAVKGRRTAPAFLPGLILTDADGTPSATAQAVLRGMAPLG